MDMLLSDDEGDAEDADNEQDELGSYSLRNFDVKELEKYPGLASMS